tara:strand:- start:136 stop:330 length:195 start_codon:yes stop_codon:yes gene_type:complete
MRIKLVVEKKKLFTTNNDTKNRTRNIIDITLKLTLSLESLNDTAVKKVKQRERVTNDIVAIIVF